MSILSKLYRFIKSDTFFWLSLSYFIVDSVWTAVFGIFPGAFDEDTHLAVIKYFTAHPNPFFGSQPIYLDKFGAIVHDSSYMYRYLMWLPWQLITHLTSNFTAQVIFLRFINVALFVAGIIIVRKLLLKITNKRAIVNFALLLFILVPITGQLASQINYDNLMFPLMGLCFLLAIKFVNSLNDKPDIFIGGIFLALSLITGLVKYTFLTMFLGVLIFVIWKVVKFRQVNKKTIWSEFYNGFLRLKRNKKLLLVLLLLISFGLFFERFGLNVVRYHTPLPGCQKVIGIARCEGSSIYQRNVMYKNSKPTIVNGNPLRFTYLWLKHMNFNLMMTINGPVSGYSIGLPLLLPYVASIVFGIVGIILTFIYSRKIFRTSASQLVGIAFLVYIVSLWILNYSGYLQTGRRVAIQGRYLVPLLPVLFTWFLLGINYAGKSYRRVKVYILLVLIICFFIGGGALNFIVHSDNSWYWQNNNTAIKVNRYAKDVFKPIIPGSNQQAPYWQNSLSF